MSQLSDEVNLLAECAIDPHALVHIARVVGCPDLLVKAFPQMPEHMRYEIYTGVRLLGQDEYGTWITTTNLGVVHA